ncbi:hypothetical protein MMPV_005846 [Pyropia vietnamensis]
MSAASGVAAAGDVRRPSSPPQPYATPVQTAAEPSVKDDFLDVAKPVNESKLYEQPFASFVTSPHTSKGYIKVTKIRSHGAVTRIVVPAGGLPAERARSPVPLDPPIDRSSRGDLSDEGTGAPDAPQSQATDGDAVPGPRRLSNATRSVRAASDADAVMFQRFFREARAGGGDGSGDGDGGSGLNVSDADVVRDMHILARYPRQES